MMSGVKTKTTETNLALENLAVIIRNNKEFNEIFKENEISDLLSKLTGSSSALAFLESFNLFLNEFGHRETSLTISQPAWRDAPEIVLGILKAISREKPRKTESYGEWIKLRDELLEHSILGSRL